MQSHDENSVHFVIQNLFLSFSHEPVRQSYKVKSKLLGFLYVGKDSIMVSEQTMLISPIELEFLLALHTS